jgi:hypothetical protein
MSMNSKRLQLSSQSFLLQDYDMIDYEILQYEKKMEILQRQGYKFCAICGIELLGRTSICNKCDED